MNKEQIPEVDYTKLEWTCTDPDNFQYGRKVYDGVYQFKEWIGGGKLDEAVEKTVKECFNESGSWEEDTIVLENFSEEYKNDVASGYYGSLEKLKEVCGESWEWIIAECIFEYQSGLY